MGDALITDLYELNMAASYLRRSMVGDATFSLFVRGLPPNRGFLVAAGLEDCLAFLESFAFDTEDLAWLRQAGFSNEDLERFAALRFTGDVHAMPEGRVVLANEPLLEVTAPIAEAQLVETYLLNQVTFQTAIATKAARCRIAAGRIELVDFALRRTHGTEAGSGGGRADAEAPRRFGLEAAGTMAHSYIEAFPTEAGAFRAFAEDFPGRTTFLVDTYDTLRGVENAIEVIKDLGLTGSLGIRLDSGDLAQLARESRAMLDAAGLTAVRIFASGALDEHDLERFRLQGVPIDAAGIGTRLGTSADAPSLDSAYKLVAYEDRPVLKLSAGKATLPGSKQVWRRHPIDQDLLATRDEPGPAGFEPLLAPVMRGGKRLGPPGSLEAARERLERDLDGLSPEARDLHLPLPPKVAVSGRLRALEMEVTVGLRRRAGDSR